MSDFFEKLTGASEIEEETANITVQNNEEETPQEEGQLAVDVFQTDNEIIIQSTIAGVKASDLDIMIQNDMVTIRGERKKEIEVNPENYFYQECYWGPFSRSIVLPEEIKSEGVSAELKNGILTIRLPKVQKTKATKIKVREILE
jgi:HSP20 family protein